VSRLPSPCVCLVTNRKAVLPDARTDADAVAALEGLIDDALQAGMDLIQIRERDLDARALQALVARVVGRSRGTDSRILVNDRADVAVAAGADGVHLRTDGPSPSRMRELLAPEVIVGRSVHSATEAREYPGADYLLFGTVFPSVSKPPDSPVAGLEDLRETARAVRTPVLAIGGVTPESVSELRQAGAAGVAAISVFLPIGRAPSAMGVGAALDAFRAAWASDPQNL